jgi:alanine racemase
VKPRSTRALIDLGVLAANCREARRRAGGTPLCAVVKADAYGHGAVPVARTLQREGIDFLAVAFLEEALELRAAGLDCGILVLGTTAPENADIVVSQRLSQTVYGAELALALDRAGRRLGIKARIHLKLDTGMHRQGLDWKDAGNFGRFLKGLEGIDLEGAYSHFAESDSLDNTYSLMQIDRFTSALGALSAAGSAPRYAHLANSAAILGLPKARFDMVRPGIILYGLSPAGEPSAPAGFEPVMSLHSEIVNLRKLGSGEGLSYGLTFRTRRDSLVALLQVGYADGYPRILSNKAQVLVGGRRAPVLGRICMDQTLIDVTDIPEVAVGDEAILFGTQDLQVGELSVLAETIDYEITCGISQRVPRIYKG